MQTDHSINVTCMTGVAANATILENIELPEDKFEINCFQWVIPSRKDNLKIYCTRISQKIEHEMPVIIGVSFGGVIVQEIAKLIEVRRVIIISSVKSEKELPRRMRFARYTKAFKVLPTSLVGRIDFFERLVMGDFAKKRFELYKKYLSVTDIRYLDWALEKMICWEQPEPIPGVVHIHGDKDIIFPYKYIDGSITVPGGTHIMNSKSFRLFNEYREQIILTGKPQMQKEEQKITKNEI